MQQQIPAGLNALIGQMMPNKQTAGANIPSGMQALIQAQQALQATAKPTTPAGTPTVAGQMEQAIAQQVQPQAPQGLPGMMPADPFREQLMKTLQAQAQAQAQAQQQGQPQPQPQAQPQGQPQPAPEGQGIAQLAAPNMQGLKEGGVVGFAAGGTDDEEDDDEESDTSGVDTSAISQIVNPERIKAMQAQRDRIMGTPLPALVSREDAYRQLDKLSPIKPWEAQKEGIEQLRKKQADILQRTTSEYEQEKASRGIGQWGALLSSHLGGHAQAVTNYQNTMAQRDAAFTKQLKDDLEFQKDLFNMSTAANKEEFAHFREQALSKVTDSQKAAELFQKDRATLVKALNGEYGPTLKLLGTKYNADLRAAQKPKPEKFNLEERAYKSAVSTIAKEMGKSEDDPAVQEAAAQRVFKYKATPAAISAESRANAADRAQALKESWSKPFDSFEARQTWIDNKAEELAAERIRNIGRATTPGAPAASSAATRAPLSSFLSPS